MKKGWMVLLTLVMVMMTGMETQAGAVDRDDGLSEQGEGESLVVRIKGFLQDLDFGEPFEIDPDAYYSEVIDAGDYHYYINEDNESVTIAEYTGEEEVVRIPENIDGYTVSEIGYQAFSYYKMKAVSIPDCVSRIGGRAFEYCIIEDRLRLPENIEIMKDAFSYALLPSVVTIPSGAKVGKCAFSYCRVLEQVWIEPDAVIGSRAFGYCDSLKQVVCAADSLVESDAFEYCHGLEEAILCGSAKTEANAFHYCENIKIVRGKESEYDNRKQDAGEEPDSFYADVKIVTPYYSMTIPEKWLGSYTIETLSTVTGMWLKLFYKAELGDYSGHLFSICLTDKDDYQVIADHRLLGDLTDPAGNVYHMVAVFPTDVQYSKEDHDSYMALSGEADAVLDTIEAAEGCSIRRTDGKEG
ncbi:MAG: leucine-rich repeat domain-containing protein [Blautia sp.]|nr:leucine-rich repeat domain-containing protein [Blautia sp.]